MLLKPLMSKNNLFFIFSIVYKSNNKLNLLLVITIAAIISLCEMSLILSTNVFTENILNDEFKIINVFNLFLFVISTLSIGPLRLIYVFKTGNININTSRFIINKLIPFYIKDWTPLNDNTANISSSILNELDYLVKDILESIWNLLLSFISLLFILISFTKITSINTLLLCTIFILISCYSIYKLSYDLFKINSKKSATNKTNVNRFVLSLIKSIRSLRLNNNIIKYAKEYIINEDSKYRQKLRNNLVLANLPKLFFELTPYILIALVILIGKFNTNGIQLNFSKIIISLVPLIVIYQRGCTYAYSAYISSFLVLGNLSRLPNIFYGLNNDVQIKSEKISTFQKNKNTDLMCIFNDVVIKYVSKKEELINIGSFQLKSGDFIGIKSPSGTGKSTLFDIICGLLEPYEGQFKFKTSINYKPRIGLLEQAPKFFFSNVVSNIVSREIKERKNINKNEIERLKFISELLKIDLNPQSKLIFTNRGSGCESLSGGERQILGIARTIFLNPDILLLDEPTAALDFLKSKNIIKGLRKLSFDNKIILVSSHKDIDFELCDYLLEKKEKSDPFTKRIIKT